MLFPSAMLSRLRFSQRFITACQLLRHIWAFDYRVPISAMWNVYYLRSWKIIDFNTSFQELIDDLTAVCRICNIPVNNDNLVLVLLCAKYRFAIRYIQKRPPSKQLDDISLQDLERRTVAYGLLAHSLWTSIKNGDFDELKNNRNLEKTTNNLYNWLIENEYIHRATYNPNMPDYLQAITVSDMPEPVYYQFAYELIHSSNNSPHMVVRDRNQMRGYFWWRSKKRGMKHKDILTKWNTTYPEDYVADENIITKAINNYEKEHGCKTKFSLGSRQRTLESVYQTENLWYEFLTTYDKAPILVGQERQNMHKSLMVYKMWVV